MTTSKFYRVQRTFFIKNDISILQVALSIKKAMEQHRMRLICMDTLFYRDRSFKLGNGSTANIKQSFNGVKTTIVQCTIPPGEDMKAECVQTTFELPLPSDREYLSSFIIFVARKPMNL